MCSSIVALWTVPTEGISDYFLSLPYFTEMCAFNINSVDPDQTLQNATCDLVYTVCQCPFYGTLGI